MSQSDDLKVWLQNVIKNNVENLVCSEEFYLQTISKDFLFQADGIKCNFEQWMRRMQSFKDQMKSLKVSFEQVICELDDIAAIYFVKGIKLDNTEVLVKIIAFFRIKNNKLVYCDELTQLVTPNVEST